MRQNSHPMHRAGHTAGKLVSAAEAVKLVRPGDTIATTGFVGIGFAENIAVALEERFLATGTPTGLTLMYAAGQGDGDSRGLNHFGHAGMVSRIIGGHWDLVPKLQRLATGNLVEAYNLPQGVICHLFRDIAAGKPGTLTRVGLGTFVDPRFGGGKINERTTTDLVRVLRIDDEDYLFYKALPIDVGIVRATTADLDGNLTMEREALTLEARAVAMAARNSGGVVIAQVERIAERGSLNARQVKVPGVLVDCVVVAEKPEYHYQTFVEPYSPAFAQEIRVPTTTTTSLPDGPRKIIARRAAMELSANDVVNLGIGMPEGVSAIANEERIIDLLTLTAEPGVIGGIPAGGLNFGAASNSQAILDQPSQFDFDDGGGLDIAVLGLAQADRHGNLNVSKFGSRLAGAGGFINISQNARTVVFVGTFTAGGLRTEVVGRQLRIQSEGTITKFVNEVEHRTFSGEEALRRGKRVLFVTERCVFRLVPDGLELVEIAPGINLERDVLDHMEFTPIVRSMTRTMDARIFADEPMDLRRDLLDTPIADRLQLDEENLQFFIDFEGLEVRNANDIERLHKAVVARLAPLGQRVRAIVNYDNFSIVPELIDPYVDMVQGLLDNYYLEATRYTSNAFTRARLGAALAKGKLDPQIFDSREKALEVWRAD
ncbi:MAG: acyl CoA:acetate/3-ketoacid CoA transferase [Propionibacteriaceae bacterium]|nr:acyl CoA:acetate/3-ketoacid CoA transferase [Propionibacteriaceae bacterium]